MLVNSAKSKSITIDVLGMSQPYPGHGQKLIWVLEYLQNIPDDHSVLFVDGFDVLIMEDKKAILNKFLFGLSLRTLPSSARC